MQESILAFARKLQGEAAGLFQLAPVVQPLCQGDDIQRVIGLHQGGHGAKDLAVALAVEIVRHQFGRGVIPAFRRQHQAADHGLLGLDGMGRHFQLLHGGIAKPAGGNLFGQPVSYVFHQSFSRLRQFRHGASDHGACPAVARRGWQ